MNPKVQVSITRSFVADHSLPEVGVAKRHAHEYSVECGYAAPIDPARGCTRPMDEMLRDVEGLVDQLRGRYLNDVIAGPPTAEGIAAWILHRLPPHWEWVAIRAYGGFMCRVDRPLTDGYDPDSGD